MPSVSDAQERMMRAASHSSSFAAKVGVPQAVAREFEAADKAKAESQKSKIKKRYRKD